MAYTRIGTIVKPHGLKGDAVLLVDALYLEAFTNLKAVFMEVHGSYIPYPITASAPLNNEKFKVKLVGIDLPEQVNALRKQDIFAPDDVLPRHTTLDLIDFSIEDQHLGHIGKVREVLEGKFQTMLVVVNDDGEYYIPLVEEFLIEVDEKNRVLSMDLPEGILDV